MRDGRCTSRMADESGVTSTGFSYSTNTAAQASKCSMPASASTSGWTKVCHTNVSAIVFDHGRAGEQRQADGR